MSLGSVHSTARFLNMRSCQDNCISETLSLVLIVPYGLLLYLVVVFPACWNFEPQTITLHWWIMAEFRRVYQHSEQSLLEFWKIYISCMTILYIEITVRMCYTVTFKRMIEPLLFKGTINSERCVNLIYRTSLQELAWRKDGYFMQQNAASHIRSEWCAGYYITGLRVLQI